MGFKSPVRGEAGGHSKFGCQSLSKGVFGEEGTARTGLGAGGRGVSREHHRVTAGNHPASYGPGEVSIREPAAPLALTTQAREQNEQREGKA